MRIALILLSILAFVFIGSLFWLLLGNEGLGGLRGPTKKPSSEINVESYWRNQIKTEEKIDKLASLIEEMAKKNNNQESYIHTHTGSVSSPPIVKLSGKFLEKIMPQISPSLIENAGIFDLLIFDKSIAYSTYEDGKIGIKMIAMNIPYDSIIVNMRAIGPTVYSVNETKTFPFRSFYLNPPVSDTLVRLVIEMEGQSIGIIIPKARFTLLKDLLLGKSTSIQKPIIPSSKPKAIQSTGTTSVSTGLIRR